MRVLSRLHLTLNFSLFVITVITLNAASSVNAEDTTLSKLPEVPWLNEIQTPPKNILIKHPKLRPILIQKDGTPITSVSAWKISRQEIRRWWLNFLHPLPRQKHHPPQLTILEEKHSDGVVRQLVRYEVEPNILTEAYLLRPEKMLEKKPGVVVFHSTVEHSIRQPAGVEGKPEKAFGFQLAKRGYVAFCPRNFLWPNNREIDANGETRKFQLRHPKSKGMAKMLHDAFIAIDILVGLPEVDSSRIGAIGHSLGAKEVLYLAALDERIKVSISSEGGVGTNFSNWNAPWYLGAEIDKKTFTHEHHELLSLVAPRAFLLIGGNSADGDQSWPYIDATLPVFRLYNNKKARFGLINHRQGHSVPPEAENKIYQWIDAYLRIK